ncbi:hypothetical protein BaRGS_00019248 [Batillaria attramentaria]|uniref:Uncharacterized protein n=1 Tax=Batillaria attramentaria TaxID=370345 RepID=A0ABD0KQL4_9CAEN
MLAELGSNDFRHTRDGEESGTGMSAWVPSLRLVSLLQGANGFSRPHWQQSQETTISYNFTPCYTRVYDTEGRLDERLNSQLTYNGHIYE